MENKNNTTCSICGKPYYVCVSCKSHLLTPWRIHTDTVEHYKIYQILHGYTCGVYTKEEAKERLNNIDLSDYKDFRDIIKDSINKIMNDSKNTDTKTNKKKSVKKTKGMNSVVVNVEV
jgi:hypothetical protein